MNSVITVLNLLPELIKAIEAMIPGEGQGEKKLAVLRKWIEDMNTDMAPFWPQIAVVAGLLVKAFNALGVFKKSQA